LTVPLAYNATSEVPLPQWREAEGAAEDLAVVWAIVRLAESMPASVEDRRALDEARASLHELAAALGTDEAGMKELLRERYFTIRESDATVLSHPSLRDGPA
jgi:predicted secreted Zn-dependent protease